MVLRVIIAFETMEKREKNVVWDVGGEMLVSNFSELMSGNCANWSMRSRTRKENTKTIEECLRIGKTSDRRHRGRIMGFVRRCRR